jgi:hypothetical protein
MCVGAYFMISQKRGTNKTKQKDNSEETGQGQLIIGEKEKTVKCSTDDIEKSRNKNSLRIMLNVFIFHKGSLRIQILPAISTFTVSNGFQLASNSSLMIK